MARIKEGETAVGRALAKNGVLDRPLTGDPFVIESIVLVKSDLKPTGPVYAKLWEVKLPEH
jgi:2'-5' RNA ligase